MNRKKQPSLSTTLSPPTIHVKLRSYRFDADIAAATRATMDKSTPAEGSPSTPSTALQHRIILLAQQTPSNMASTGQNTTQLYMFHASNHNTTTTATATAAIENIKPEPISENKQAVGTLLEAVKRYLLNHTGYQNENMDCGCFCFTVKSSKPKLVYDNISQLQKHLDPNIKNWQGSEEQLYKLAHNIESTLKTHTNLKNSQEQDAELSNPLKSALTVLQKALKHNPNVQKGNLSHNKPHG